MALRRSRVQIPMAPPFYMSKEQELKLIENQDEISKPFFTEEEYQSFRERFSEAVAEENKKWKIARMNSIRASMFRFVN